MGLCLDNISVSNADQTQALVLNDVPPGNSFVFSPTTSGDYLLRVRAQLPGRTLPWGPITRVSTTTNLPPMQIQFTGMPQRTGNQFQVDFAVQNFKSGTTFQLLTASSLPGIWTPDTTASFQTLVAGSRFRVVTTNNAGMAFYRIGVK